MHFLLARDLKYERDLGGLTDILSPVTVIISENGQVSSDGFKNVAAGVITKQTKPLLITYR